MNIENKNQNYLPSRDKVNEVTDSSLAFSFALSSDVSSSAESVMEYLSPLTKALYASNIMEGLRGLVIGNSEANILLNKIHEQRLRNISKRVDVLPLSPIISEESAFSDGMEISQLDPGSLDGVKGPSKESALGDDDINGYAV
jgi:hypothetical protein